MRAKVAIVVVCLLLALPCGAATQQWLDFLGAESRQASALVGVGGTSWVWPGSALTASVNKAWFNLNLPTAQYVRLLVVWNPRGDSGNGVRLVHADDGPTNITELGAVSGSTATTPIVSTLDLTTDWNSLGSGGVAKNLGMQLRGNPYVFRVTLEIVNY